MTYPYETATPEQKAIGAWWWCVHHEVHLEQLTEPAENRTAYIKAEKPAEEIDRRLREFAPVLHPERLPKGLLEALAERDKAVAECVKAWAERVKAWAEYDMARVEYAKTSAERDKAWAEREQAAAVPGLQAGHEQTAQQL